MSVQLSNKILISFYCILTCVYLFTSVDKGFENLTGNRAIGAICAFVYFATILFGLFRKPRIFSAISLFNFIIGSLFIVVVIFSGLPEFSMPLFLYLCFGVLGGYLSLNSLNARKGI
ncbi:hypothetical protein D1Z90_20280 [Motilimonas pumila]|uniref:Uncharacterized protein n=1 Tax=Motilimonas pumila TaxID=2303987 RepID=A0A418Y982_9GAMM|nr:hypothetical protein D1Z90_20280 [Motilimonas pumila]